MKLFCSLSDKVPINNELLLLRNKIRQRLTLRLLEVVQSITLANGDGNDN